MLGDEEELEVEYKRQLFLLKKKVIHNFSLLRMKNKNYFKNNLQKTNKFLSKLTMTIS